MTEQNDANRLANLMIAAPCNVGWDNMTGTDKMRHCNECKLNVYNISEMTSVEAETLLRSDAMNSGRACVSFYRRADGTILTKDCPEGLAKIRATAQKAIRAVAAAFTVLFASLPAFGTNAAKKSTTMNKEPEVLSSAPGLRGTAGTRGYGTPYPFANAAYFGNDAGKASFEALRLYKRGQKTENEGKIAAALYYYRQSQKALQGTAFDPRFGTKVSDAVKRTEKSLKETKQSNPDCPKATKNRTSSKTMDSTSTETSEVSRRLEYFKRFPVAGALSYDLDTVGEDGKINPEEIQGKH